MYYLVGGMGLVHKVLQIFPIFCIIKPLTFCFCCLSCYLIISITTKCFILSVTTVHYVNHYNSSRHKNLRFFIFSTLRRNEINLLVTSQPVQWLHGCSTVSHKPLLKRRRRMNIGQACVFIKDKSKKELSYTRILDYLHILHLLPRKSISGLVSLIWFILISNIDALYFSWFMRIFRYFSTQHTRTKTLHVTHS